MRVARPEWRKRIGVLLYYITDRTQFPGSESEKRRQVLAKIEAAARAGVDFIQLREKDLTARELEELALQATAALVRTSSPTRLLINSRTDVAFATGANGVHLRSNDISPREARAVWTQAHGRTGRAPSPAIIAVSCHTQEDVLMASTHGADFAVFGPVFGKAANPGTGIEALRAACRSASITGSVPALVAVPMPVLALGNISMENARECLAGGAAGIAGIRLFQEHPIQEIVAKLASAK
ncbi:MAG TPA: thiamine phosphate synthase [Terriglobales bacterium]|nr:thiamine phosphate synthase [Terriglobales bacterium]